MHRLEAIALCFQTGEYGTPCALCAEGDRTKPHNIVFRCACSSWASGKGDHIWTAVPDGEGTVALTPSVDWPDHFHEFYSHVRVVSMAKLHRLEDAV